MCIFLLLMSIMVSGCEMANGNEANELYKFDNSKLQKELKSVDFKPRLPTKLPIEVTDFDYTVLPSQSNVIDISFESETDKMQLQIVNGETSVFTKKEKEKVKIADSTGEYFITENGVKVLVWRENGISYSLTYFSNQSGKDIEKQALIKSAESFE